MEAIGRVVRVSDPTGGQTISWNVKRLRFRRNNKTMIDARVE